ncbi:ATP-binding protein [Streptomyces sp. NPDC001339]|uniref:ATP-binding protein n=1 Tax=Streptomyces sp. NPDC001339 TaxID=3364563 RepID=UPI0036B55F7D
MSTRARPVATRHTPPQSATATYRLPGDSRSAGRAREALRCQLRVWGVDGEITFSAELLVSELVTNAVNAQVQEPIDAEVGVRFVLSDGWLRLEVHDMSDELPVIERVEEDAECGRGLVLVDALASCWGVDRGDIGKTVWAELVVGGGSWLRQPTSGRNRL